MSRPAPDRAAFDLVDTDGVGALTIGRLARELGVSPMTIYGYVASKDDIVLTLPELLFAGVAEFPHVARIADRLGADVDETQFLAGLRRILGTSSTGPVNDPHRNDPHHA